MRANFLEENIGKLWRQILPLFLISLLLFSLFSIDRVSKSTKTVKSSPPICKTVKHKLGKSCIPLTPQRVVAMDQEVLEILVALGIQPIATTTASRVNSKYSLLKEKITTIVDLGKEGQPNLEKIVRLKPDLIMGMWIQPQIYGVLSSIAPTVEVDYSQTNWQKSLMTVADILNRRDRAEQLISDYQNKITDLRAQLSKRIDRLNVCVMRFYTTLEFTQFLNQKSFAVNTIQNLKIIDIPAIQKQQVQIPNTDYGYFNTSLEQVDLLDADLLLIAVDPGAENSLRHYTKSPLWQKLKVVQRGQVYLVDSGYWMFGNILSANAILDDVARIVKQL